MSFESALMGLYGVASQGIGYHLNKKQANHAFKLNKQMFDYQNAYNTPAMQMQRIKDAGLNPHLMYGQGTTGNAQGYPQYQPPTADFNPAQVAQSVAAGTSMDLANKQKSLMNSEIFKNFSQGDLNYTQEFKLNSLLGLEMDNMEMDLIEKQSRVSLNEIRTIMEQENVKLNGFQQLQVQEMTKKISTEIKLNNEVLKEYQKGFSKNPLKTVTQMLGIPNLTEPENRTKALVTAASLASGRTLITSVGKKISQTGFFRGVYEWIKRQPIGFVKK